MTLPIYIYIKQKNIPAHAQEKLYILSNAQNDVNEKAVLIISLSRTDPCKSAEPQRVHVDTHLYVQDEKL